MYFTERTVTPFLTVIPRRLGDIYLRDFKMLFDRPGVYRFHFKAPDAEYGFVKEEVCHCLVLPFKIIWDSVGTPPAPGIHIQGAEGLPAILQLDPALIDRIHVIHFSLMTGTFQIGDDDMLLPGFDGKIVAWVEEIQL